MAAAHVLNVISKEARLLAARLAEIGGPARWLSEGYAFDLDIAGDPDAALREARRLARDLEADVNVAATAARRKALLIADMDSTIITCECLDELADFAGLKERVSAITERAMRGEIAFEGALRMRVGMLKGLPLDTLARVWAERIRLTDGARTLLATMKAHGARTYLVSGGFTFFTSRVAEATGFHEARANTLLDDGSALTGEVGMPILGKEAKLQTLEAESARHGIALADTLAVGDGANDLPMIMRAGLGVAFHAKPKVAETAPARIDHGNLRALLYLQGYRDDEIVTC